MQTELDKIKDLKKQVDESIKNDDPENYLESMNQLQRVYCSIAYNFLMSDFQSAHEYFVLATEVNNELVDSCRKLLLSIEEQKEQEMFKKVSDILSNSEINQSISKAFASFTQGITNRWSGMFEQSKRDFEEARTVFVSLQQSTGEGIYYLFSDYSLAHQFISEGQEFIIRGDYGRAKSLFKRAQTTVEEMLEKLTEYFGVGEDSAEIAIFERNLKNDSKLCETLYYVSDARDLFIRGDFALSVEQYSKLCEITAEVLRALPEKIPKAAKNLQLGDFHANCGSKFLSEGEMLREQGKWQESLEAYKNARKEWSESSTFFLKSGIPRGVAMQETMLNQLVTIDMYVRACKKEMDFNDKITSLEHELNSFRTSLTDALKQSGVTVNSTAQIESTVEQNAQFIQSIEGNIKRNIEDLVNEVENLPLDKTTKDIIREKAKKVTQSNETGHKFLERVKNFTEEVAPIINNLGQIGATILPYLKYLTFFK